MNGASPWYPKRSASSRRPGSKSSSKPVPVPVRPIPDSAYVEAGARSSRRPSCMQQSDVILRVAEADRIRGEDPAQGPGASSACCSRCIDPQLVKALADGGVTAISLDAIPRTLSRAQTMDALSSQANVGGYKAVLIAANAYGRYFPLLTTAAGTAKPANVLILGIGVAGPAGDRHGEAARCRRVGLRRPTRDARNRPRASAPSS